MISRPNGIVRRSGKRIKNPLLHLLLGRLVCGKLFKGVYHLYKDETYLYQSGQGSTIQEVRIVKGLNSPELDAAVGDDLAQQLRDEQN